MPVYAFELTSRTLNEYATTSSHYTFEACPVWQLYVYASSGAIESDYRNWAEISR